MDNNRLQIKLHLIHFANLTVDELLSVIKLAETPEERQILKNEAFGKLYGKRKSLGESYGDKRYDGELEFIRNNPKIINLAKAPDLSDHSFTTEQAEENQQLMKEYELDPDTDYEALEKKHLGDYEKKTGIYDPKIVSKQGSAPTEKIDSKFDFAREYQKRFAEEIINTKPLPDEEFQVEDRLHPKFNVEGSRTGRTAVGDEQNLKALPMSDLEQRIHDRLLKHANFCHWEYAKPADLNAEPIFPDEPTIVKRDSNDDNQSSK